MANTTCAHLGILDRPITWLEERPGSYAFGPKCMESPRRIGSGFIPYFQSVVKRAPKPDLVKPRPTTIRRFCFTEPAVLQLYKYIFVTSYILANVVHAPPVTACPRHLLCRFVSSPSAVLPVSLGSVFLVSAGCHQFHLDRAGRQLLACTLLSRRPGADDNADDVQC